MTCIAWDGKTLAADKMSCSVGYGYTVTKIYRLANGGIVGFSGDGDGAMALLAWLNSPRDAAAYPLGQSIECQRYAMGHGRDFALAAMHLGKSAREAVEVACALDVFCGNGIDTLELT